jgi:hypothetical protein
MRAPASSTLRISTRCCSAIDSASTRFDGSMSKPSSDALLRMSRAISRNRSPWLWNSGDGGAVSRMFCATVNGRTSLKCWWTMPMRCLAASRGPLKRTVLSSTSSCPASGA